MAPTDDARGGDAPPRTKRAGRAHPLTEEEREELARDLEDLSRRQFVL